MLLLFVLFGTVAPVAAAPYDIPVDPPKLYTSKVVIVNWTESTPTVEIRASQFPGSDDFETQAPMAGELGSDGAWHFTFTVPVSAPYQELTLFPSGRRVIAVVHHGKKRAEFTLTPGEHVPPAWWYYTLNISE